MGGFDSATWDALGLVLTLLGLGASAVVWRRRGVASGLRAVAWSLLPLAAAMTGVLRLGWEIGDSVTQWAARLVFSPVVWLGIVLAGVSAVLFVVSGFARRRTTGPQGVAGGSGVPATTGKAAGPSKALKPAKSAKSARAGSVDDAAGMEDIDAILRKHGIS